MNRNGLGNLLGSNWLRFRQWARKGKGSVWPNGLTCLPRAFHGGCPTLGVRPKMFLPGPRPRRLVSSVRNPFLKNSAQPTLSTVEEASSKSPSRTFPKIQSPILDSHALSISPECHFGTTQTDRWLQGFTRNRLVPIHVQDFSTHGRL